MDAHDSPRLGDITTLWTMVRQAHGNSPDGVGAAQRVLMERYSGAVYRYLLGAVRDRDTADELFQEFALRFIRGDFRNADPQRGRFRDFVKTSLYHLIVDHQKKGKKPGPLPLDACPEPAASDPVIQDQAFLDSWRSEILNRTWEALKADSEETANHYYQVLHFRAEHPDLSSQQMADQLSEVLGKPVRADWVRQTIRRAREKFGQLLLAEISQLLEAPTRERLEEELTDLGLLAYCQDALPGS
jgi:RNA polymerase sigma-70 factor (ECF subfamily)